jgi:hypothetical protein
MCVRQVTTQLLYRNQEAGWFLAVVVVIPLALVLLTVHLTV